MAGQDRTDRWLLPAYLFLIVYLVINTGVVSDDLEAMMRVKAGSFAGSLVPKGNFYFISTPLQYYTQYIWYRFFDIYNNTGLNILKIFYMLISFVMIARFFAIFTAKRTAYLISFLFIFFQSHDSTVYWFMGQYLTFSIASYLYAFYLAHRGRLVAAFLFALAASFMSYGSTPVAISLFMLFAFRRRLREGLVLLVPNVLYIAYYLLISKVTALGVDRISGASSAAVVFKQFILQAVTFFDATLGPSAWLKIYYSFGHLTPISVLIGCTFAAIIYISYSGDEKPDPGLTASLSMLMVASLAMFAATGYYPQMAFNLGNRVTIFGSLLLAYLIMTVPSPKAVRMGLVVVMLLAALGISDHWKLWSARQQQIFKNIANSACVRNHPDDRMLYVSGNQYSKYGPFSHIEFLSESFVTEPAFRLATGRGFTTLSLNRNHKYVDGYIVDMRNGTKTKADGYIDVYDSEKDACTRLVPGDINGYIDGTPVYLRHWAQMPQAAFFKKAAIRLMPRLGHVL